MLGEVTQGCPTNKEQNQDSNPDLSYFRAFTFTHPTILHLSTKLIIGHSLCGPPGKFANLSASVFSSMK